MSTLQTVTRFLQANRRTVTCAESCTVCLLASEFTKLLCISEWFEAGFVTYSNFSKQNFLGVQNETLLQYGAVSEQTVREMAEGALKAAGADYALSISGIAGPTGGTDEKPVGTVWFGLASTEKTWVKTALFFGDRNNIREQAVEFSLVFLAEHLHN